MCALKEFYSAAKTSRNFHDWSSWIGRHRHSYGLVATFSNFTALRHLIVPG